MSGSYNLASIQQYNKLMWLFKANYQHDNNGFFHNAMNLERQDLGKDVAWELISELLKDFPDHQYVQSVVTNILSKPKINKKEQS